MIDNFWIFNFEWVDWEFYFFQIIKRKKDNPDTAWINWNNHMRCIKEYTIWSKESLDKHRQEMIEIANATNSRIYMHPTRRSYEEIKKEMCFMIWENIKYNKHNLHWLYRSACGQNKWTNKLWIVDIDTKSIRFVKRIWKFISTLKPWKEPYQYIKTKNWRHIISYPFDLQEFKHHFEIEVHRNNPTLMYFNNQ